MLRKPGDFARAGVAFAMGCALFACGLGSGIDDYSAASGDAQPPTSTTSAGGTGVAAGGNSGGTSNGASGGGHAAAGSKSSGGSGGAPATGAGGTLTAGGSGGLAAGGGGGVGAAGGHAGAISVGGQGTSVGGHAGATSVGGHAGTSAIGGSPQAGGASAVGGAPGMGGSSGGSAGTTSSGDPCSAEGTFECAGPAQDVVLTCAGGTWIVSASCQNGQLCDSSKPAAAGDRCANPVAACIGHPPGSILCDGPNRVVCGPDLVTSMSMTCASAAVCMNGVGPACAVCGAGDFQCTGADLAKCASDGSGFVPVKTCMTAALCNVTVGDCSAAKCAPGQFRCTGDTLQKCDTQLDGFTDVTTCPSGTCDAINGHCDTCSPGQVTCADAGTTSTCAMDGVGTAQADCPASLPHCIGQGQCAACAAASDCPPASQPCMQASCSNGTCGQSPVGAGVALSAQTKGDCATAVCDGMGNTGSNANPMDLPANDGNPCHSPTCGSDGKTPGQANRSQGTPCGNGMICNTTGVCCSPQSCATTPGACLPASDSCGGSYGPCQTCTSPDTCDAKTNSCVCIPKSDDVACANAQYECGHAPDGCDGVTTATCGACDPAYHCSGGHCICTCFTAGARVTMGDGSERAIETLHPGDEVLTYDFDLRALVVSQVTETFAHAAADNEEGLLLINGDVEATPNHPFYSSGRWVRADELRVGAELIEIPRMTEGGLPAAARSGVVRSIEQRNGGKRTYNLEVRGTHTYFVNGVLVHNKLPC